MESYNLPEGVTKKVLAAGKGDIPLFPNDTKVFFHYRAFALGKDEERTLLDDSRADKTPFELILGKKFKLEIWETMVKTMRVEEIAEFYCETYHVGCYPVVSKSLRDMKKKKCDHSNGDDHHEHQCGFAAFSKGLGYKDLDDYIKDPKPICFQVELVKLELPGNYEQELWSLSLEEQLAKLPVWREEGNELYKKGELAKASEKYSTALGCLEKLQTREKPGSDDWNRLDNMKIAFLLNYSQCMISMKEYYKAIEHLSTVLEKDPVNVKGLYRRAKANHLVHNYAESKRDYDAVKQLDKTLIATVECELKKIVLDEKAKEKEDRKKYKNAFK